MAETRLEKERRAFERMLVKWPIRFKTDRENVLNEASTRDFSDAGLGLFSRQRIEPALHLELWVEFLPDFKPLQINGKVVWTKQEEPALWRAGICFDERAFIKIMKMLKDNNQKDQELNNPRT